MKNIMSGQAEVNAGYTNNSYLTFILLCNSGIRDIPPKGMDVYYKFSDWTYLYDRFMIYFRRSNYEVNCYEKYM